jgi:o-succinylbenzoate---CoA ligase
MLMNTDKIQINGQVFSVEDLQQKLKNGNILDWEKGIYEFIVNWFDDADFILQQTSGSTGTPKNIQLKKSAMVASAQKTIDFFNLKANDAAWLCLPIAYIAGKMMAVRAIVGQFNLLITKPEGTPSLPGQPVDFVAMVPMQLQNIISQEAGIDSIRQLIIGGAAVSDTLKKSLQGLSTKIYATYGMTETCSHIALQRINGPKPDEHFQLLDGIQISTNEKHCLIINAPEFSAEYIETTDLVHIISPKKFKLLGRADHVINSGGIKISPEQLETQISEIIHRECLIVPLEDDLLGQKMVLVLEKSDEAPVSKELLKKIKNIVGKHHTPGSVYYVNEFPRNASMKIDRKEVIKQLNINL